MILNRKGRVLFARLNAGEKWEGESEGGDGIALSPAMPILSLDAYSEELNGTVHFFYILIVISDNIGAICIRGEREDVGPLRPRNLVTIVQALRVPGGGHQECRGRVLGQALPHRAGKAPRRAEEGPHRSLRASQNHRGHV